MVESVSSSNIGAYSIGTYSSVSKTDIEVYEDNFENALDYVEIDSDKTSNNSSNTENSSDATQNKTQDIFSLGIKNLAESNPISCEILNYELLQGDNSNYNNNFTLLSDILSAYS